MGEVGAVVLCGGESRRMGRSKAWLPVDGEPMLARVVRLVGEVADSVVVVAAPGQTLPDLPAGVRVVRDEVEGRGPLQGLAAGFEAVDEGTTFVYATATDVPFLVPAWVGRLADLIGDADLAVPEVGGHLQPLAALYRRATCLPAVRALLASGGDRPIDLAGRVRARVVGADELRSVDLDLATLANVNTPEAYRDALQRGGFTAEDAERKMNE